MLFVCFYVSEDSYFACGRVYFSAQTTVAATEGLEYEAF
jgi:hypothetical protein